ncbi:MAG: amidohydrolase [Deltaproteobacteria bacterium]|nr:amidohydrolase [Deltaproteobacteria bacterium]
MSAETKSATSHLQAAERLGHVAIETVASAEAPLVFITEARIMTAAGEIHEQGYIAMANGRIEAVGVGAPPSTDGAHVIAAPGMVVTPGLIDTHSHLGVYPAPSAKAHSDGNEMTTPITAGVWAEHAFWPQDPGIQRALMGGVTTLMALPGSGNLIGGRGVTLHTVPRRGSRAMRYPGAPDGVKMACGENPKRVYGTRNSSPQTRMGNLYVQRSAFIDAVEYKKKLDKAEAPKRDLKLETLVGLMEGELLGHVHCYRADDMINMLQLADEFGFKIRSFHHAVEAYKIRDILAERDVSVSTWADWWGFKMEAYDAIQENAALLSEAGGMPIIHSDSARGIRRLNQEAAKAMAHGRRAGIEISENEALRWITYNAAWALGIEGDVGTLEPGKRADIVVWDGSPFSVYSSARWVFIDGVLRHDSKGESVPWSDFEVGQEVQP